MRVAVGRSPCVAEPNAKPLVADRLSFPLRPTFDPSPLFDDSAPELCKHPLSKGRDCDSLSVPPLVQVCASPNEKFNLFKKMAESG